MSLSLPRAREVLCTRIPLDTHPLSLCTALPRGLRRPTCSTTEHQDLQDEHIVFRFEMRAVATKLLDLVPQRRLFIVVHRIPCLRVRTCEKAVHVWGLCAWDCISGGATDDRPRLPMHVDKTLPMAERDTSSCRMYLGWLTFIRD